MAHLVAQTEGYDAIEFNASDVRSKKALEVLIFILKFRMSSRKLWVLKA